MRPAPHAYHLAAVAYSLEQRLLFVGTPGSGVIDVFRTPAGGLDGPQLFVTRLANPPRKHVLRLGLDRAHGRLWALDINSVDAYELERFALLGSFHRGRMPNYERFTDLAVGSGGEVYVYALTPRGARIYRIEASSREMKVWIESSLWTSDPGISLATRVASTTDGKYLLLVSPLRATIVRVNLASRAIGTVGLSEPVDLACGALFWGPGPPDGGKTADAHGPAATVLHCPGKSDVQIEFADDFSRGSVRTAPPSAQRGAPSRAHWKSSISGVAAADSGRTLSALDRRAAE
jgi:hypothetical protein